MTRVNPRSQLGDHLWISTRARGYFRFLVTAVLGWAIGLISTAGAESRPPELNQAEVEPFEFSDPPEDLLLDESGERKRQALLLYYRGISLEESDTPGALKFFRQVIELDPSNVVLAMEAATHCAVNGNFTEAQELLEESLEENPGNLDAYLNLSRYCDTHHNDDDELRGKALEYARQGYEKFPGDPVAFEFYARLLIDREDRVAAEALLEKELKREDGSGDYWLAMGNVARDVWPMRNEENRKRVLGIFGQALRVDPENPETIERVAQFFQIAGATDQALRLYQGLVERHPDRLSARGDLAELYWQVGQHEAAVAVMEALVQIDPDELSVRRKVVEMYLAMKDLDGAFGHCEQIINSGDGAVDDYLRLSAVQQLKDRPGGALRTLREAASTFPDSPDLSYALGRLYLNLDRYAEAYGALEMAEGQAEAGQAEFLSEGFYFDYAVCAERLGEIERAAELFQKSIELVPADMEEEKAKSLNYLGYMWLEREEKIDEAGEMILKANELKPDNIAYLDSLGWFYFLKEDYEAAIKHLKRAEELMGEGEPDGEILEHLARAYDASGDFEQARRYARRALALDPEDEGLQELVSEIEEGASAD